MNKEYVWWTLVNSAATLIKQIKNSVENEKNVYISSESVLPWKETFYSLSRSKIAEVSSHRSIDFLSAKGVKDPGYFIMTKMCTSSICSEYWPDMTYAQFLSQYSDLILNNRIVWVRDIENDILLEKWFDFISEYCRLSEEKEHEHAIFIVEHTGRRSTKTPPSSITSLKFSSNYFDRYIFALSMLSELSASCSVKQYIAELAVCLCKDDAEFCGELIEEGQNLMQAPNVCVGNIRHKKRSSGTQFPSVDNDEIYSSVLMAQIKIIFPVIEQFRLKFIKSHEQIIKNNLPIINSFNEIIDEASDLELRDLCSLLKVNVTEFDEAEKKNLLKFREYRNKLAHNDTINWQEIEKILDG